MIVTLDEFKTGVERYLRIVGDEGIVITENGRKIAQITPPDEDEEDLEAVMRSLRGILPVTATVEEAHEERIAKHERHL